MKEQKVFKELEETAPTFEEDLAEMLELFDKLQKVSDVRLPPSRPQKTLPSLTVFLFPDAR